MQGAVQIGNIEERAELALAAGCDMVLVCNDPKGAVKVIDGLPSNLNLEVKSLNRIKSLRKIAGLNFSALKKTKDYHVASKALNEFYAN
jgi:beta-N-acetylhexosaminidase